MQLIADSLNRLILRSSANATSLWADVAEAGFLDLLVQPEDDQLSSTSMTDVFAIAFLLGRHGIELPIVETILGRGLLGDAAPPGMILLHNSLDWPETVRTEASVVVGGDAQPGHAGYFSAGVPPTHVQALAAASMAARLAGAMQAITALTIEYALVRKQFGQSIARFQAVQQHIALMAEETTAAAMAASRCLAGAPTDFREIWAAVAKSRCCRAAEIVGAAGHAVHGAIGVSEEHALGRHTLHLRSWSKAYGGESFWQAKLGESILAGAWTVGDFVLTQSRA